MFLHLDATQYFKLPNSVPQPTVIKYISSVIEFILFPLQLTLTPINVIFNLAVAYLKPPTKDLSNYKLRPLGIERLSEMEQRVRSLAQKYHIAKADAITIGTAENIGTSPGASHNYVEVPPEYLVKRTDLPKQLSLDKLERNELTEEEWLFSFQKWLDKNVKEIRFVKGNDKCTVDLRLSLYKVWLQLFRQPEVYDKAINWILSHELGHVAHDDYVKSHLVILGLSIVSIASIGTLYPLCKKVFLCYCKYREKIADEFATKHTPFKYEAKVYFETLRSELMRLRAKYPDLVAKIDERGNPQDHGHPLITDRIMALKKA